MITYLANKSVQATAACGFLSILWFLFMCPFCRSQSRSAAVPDLHRYDSQVR